MTLFSQRNAVLDRFRYDLPEHVRSRILHTLNQCMALHCQTIGFDDMLYELGHKLQARYGGLNRPSYVAARRSDNPVIEHFLCSADELASISFSLPSKLTGIAAVSPRLRRSIAFSRKKASVTN